ncbi:sensor histidine kinase [Chryseobacterium sp. PTM-20240506]|uniref:sensor histidine kinase n=1 Tax=unclassified Chryseobacterium TaxID=2593645 RepID=UPI00235A3F66|nr:MULTISPECIES: histidine kinase [unclassified Chryseobacterium]MDC8106456.1 histidine kinase [Chryseobacterium sp. B21-037]MDQ1804959.1 histidine kinase [Chryseobacterium sp. CKR4-1]
MTSLNELKLTYAIITVVMLFFVVFIIFVVLMYNRKQLLFVKEKQLKEAEYQNQLLQKELEKQKLIEQERERISHDMHDDLGAGISALKLQAEFLKQKAENSDLTNDIDELLKTSEEMNISMREMLWNLNTGNDTIGSFTSYSKMYTESFLKKTSINFIVTDRGIIQNMPVSAEIRRNMFLCLKESLNNAYKHSKANKISISFSQRDREFSMEISDDGIGMIEGKNEGNGLRNMKRRMKELNGEFEIVSKEDGTAVIFTIEI